MFEEYYSAEKAAHLISTLSYDEDTKLFTNDNRNKSYSLSFAFLCTPLTGADDATESRLRTLLNEKWPRNSILSVSTFTNEDIHHFTNDYLRARQTRIDSLFDDITENRIKFLQSAAIDGLENLPIKIRDIQCIVSVKIPIDDEIATEDEIDIALKHSRNIYKTLEGIRLFPVQMDNKLYVKIMRNILNQGNEASWNDNFPTSVEEDTPLNDQIFDFHTDIDVKKTHVKLGSKYFRTMSAKRLPDSPYMNLSASYLGDFMTGQRGIRDNTLITMSVFFPDTLALKSSMEHKRDFNTTQYNTPLQKFVPMLKEKHRSYESMTESFKEGNSPLKVYLSVTQFADDLEQLDYAVANVRSYWSELHFQIQADVFINLPLFINSLPMSADYKAISFFRRHKTITSKEAVTLLPIIGEWKGTGSPKMNLIGRQGQLMHVDNYDSPDNFNVVVAAKSGAGKSFFTNNLTTNTLSTGGAVWIIDVGRSYLNICNTYGGEFIDFGPDSKICLNPFPIVKDWDDEADMLAALIVAMAAPTTPLTDQQTSNLKKIMNKAWVELGKKTTISHIAEQCLKSEDRRISDIGEQLYSFTEEGEYGKYFNGENNVKFDNKFTVLELDDLQGRKHLQTVVVLQLIYQIQQKMYFGDINQQKKVIIDEAWSLLSEGDVAKFIEHGYRRFRKYNGSAFTITQSMFDLMHDRTGKAILENSAHKWLLAQTQESVNGLEDAKALSTNSTGYELLRSVHTMDGDYSEIMCMTPYGTGIGRLVVDPFQLLLYSTKAKDKGDLKKYTDLGFSISDAVLQVLSDRGSRYGRNLMQERHMEELSHAI